VRSPCQAPQAVVHAGPIAVGVVGVSQGHRRHARRPRVALARLFVIGVVAKRVLAVGWNAEKVVANSLFADGAGAVVLKAGMAPADALYRVVASGSTVIPESEEAMSWRVGDHGFEMTLSTRVPDLIAGNLGVWLDGWLGAYRLTVRSVGSWAVHPGGPRILAAVVEALEIDRRALANSHAVLAEFGNMSSPTVLFILERIRRDCAPRPCVALGFGPGLAVEALLLV
jgi:predicted naringenin-chalcone synthase